MFCDACGEHLLPGQSYCARCGKAVIGPVVGEGRVARHLQPLGILWIAYSALHLIGGVALLILANTLFAGTWRFGMPPGATPPPWFVHPVLTFLGWCLLVKAIAGLAGGVGLMQRQPWARMVTLIVAIVSLIDIPLGTALGVYTLWALVSAGADQEWAALVAGVG
jgi:hypothetical protein